MAHKHSVVRDGKRLIWYAERLWELARELEPFEIAIDDVAEMDQNCWFSDREPTVRRVAEHCRRIMKADLSHPIILNADGSLMDGGHRICKALLDDRSVVLAVRFDVMPEPDEIVPWGRDGEAPAIIHNADVSP